MSSEQSPLTEQPEIAAAPAEEPAPDSAPAAISAVAGGPALPSPTNDGDCPATVEADESGPTSPLAVDETADAPATAPAPAPAGAEQTAPRPDGDDLEELTLPSLVQAPPIIAPGTVVGTDGRLTVDGHLETRGRVNRYAARWLCDDGQEITVALCEGPQDHMGLCREAEILTAVRYAMLPRCYQTWEQDDRRYLALDRLDGPTLEDALRSGLTPDRALSLMLQLVQVVRRLHRAGWALLGLTPADIYPGQPLRIGQFGHAARLGEVLPQALQVAGYSAPELAHPETVTGKEDVYTIGALLYAALAGGPLPEAGVELAELRSTIRLPGAPQVLADALDPAEDRLALEDLYARLLALRRRQAAPPLTLEVASATTVGLNPTRPVNEDSCAYMTGMVAGADGVEYRALLCVADGMGGMEAGEIASQTAINAVMHGVGDAISPARRPASESDGADSASAEAPQLDPVGLVKRAATAVHAAAQGRELGSTMTCVAVQHGELTLGHVGDTRAYLLRGGTLRQITADHSLVAAMVASGVITKDEARGHPDSNKVLRSLGSQHELPDGYVDGLSAAFGQSRLPLLPGDWLMICSDGVWGTVADAEIQVILAEALDCPSAAGALIDRALQAGAPDNATTVVARCVAMPAL
jgi:serine/threonine protein phosphatase PrpC